MIVTVASVVIGVLKSCVLPFTVIAKAALAKPALILFAMSNPLTPLSISKTLPSGSLIATMLNSFVNLVYYFC